MYEKKDLDLYFDFEDQLPKQTSDQDVIDKQKKLLKYYRDLIEEIQREIDFERAGELNYIESDFKIKLVKEIEKLEKELSKGGKRK